MRLLNGDVWLVGWLLRFWDINESFCREAGISREALVPYFSVSVEVRLALSRIPPRWDRRELQLAISLFL